PHLPPHRTACDLGGAGLDRLRHPIHALTQPRRTRVWSVDVGGELLVEILWRNLGWDKIASLTHGFLVEVLSEGAGGGQGEFFGIGWAVVVVDRRLHRVVLVFVGAHDSSFIDGLVSGSELLVVGEVSQRPTVDGCTPSSAAICLFDPPSLRNPAARSRRPTPAISETPRTVSPSGAVGVEASGAGFSSTCFIGDGPDPGVVGRSSPRPTVSLASCCRSAA